MGQSTPFNREIVFTDASLTVAAARQREAALEPRVEAERILKEFPGSGVTLEELIDVITEMIASCEPASGGIALAVEASGSVTSASDLSYPGADGE